jgi:hypothetical protein
MLCSASTVATTAAAPAVNANDVPELRLSKALGVFAVVPMTCFSASVTSERIFLIGDRSGVCLAKGELDGVSLRLPVPHAGLIIRELDGVSDISQLEG